MLPRKIMELRDAEDFRKLSRADENIDEVIENLLEAYEPNLSRRSNATLLSDGKEYATNLDLLHALQHLRDRGARLMITEYDRVLPRGRASGMVTSESNRNGRLLEMVSNKENHAFSVMLLDQNVVQHGNKGAPRNFRVVSPEGEWYSGMGDLHVLDEIQGLERFETEPGKITFKHFASPGMAATMYSAKKLMLMAAVDRVEEESRAYRKLAAKLKEELRISAAPATPKGISPIYQVLIAGSEEVEGEKREIEVLESRIGGFGVRGRYPMKAMDYDGNVEELDVSGVFQGMNWHRALDMKTWKNVLRYSEWRKNLTFSLAAHRMRAMDRAIDLAFYKRRDVTPAWDVPEWQQVKDWNFIQFGSLFTSYKIKKATVQERRSEPEPTQDLYI